MHKRRARGHATRHAEADGQGLIMVVCVKLHSPDAEGLQLRQRTEVQEAVQAVFAGVKLQLCQLRQCANRERQLGSQAYFREVQRS